MDPWNFKDSYLMPLGQSLNSQDKSHGVLGPIEYVN